MSEQLFNTQSNNSFSENNNSNKYQNLRQMLPNQGLSGGLHIKLKVKNQVKRVIVPNLPTYDELCFLIQRHLKNSLSNNVNNLKLFYLDDDNDLVNLNDDNDLSIALSFGSTLKVYVFDSQTAPYPDEAFSAKSPFNPTGLQVLELKQLLLDLDNKINLLVKKDPSLANQLNNLNIAPKQNTTTESTTLFDPLSQTKTETSTSSALPSAPLAPSAPSASNPPPSNTANCGPPSQPQSQQQYPPVNTHTPSAPSQPPTQYPPTNSQPPTQSGSQPGYPPSSGSQSFNQSPYPAPNSSSQPFYPPPPPPSSNNSFYPPAAYPPPRPGFYPPSGGNPPPPPPSNYHH